MSTKASGRFSYKNLVSSLRNGTIKKLVTLRHAQPMDEDTNPKQLHTTDSNDSKQNTEENKEDIDTNMFDFNDDEFNDDDGQWDDLDIIPANEQIVTSCLDYSQYSNNESFEECWKCTKCNTMNNVKLSIRIYHYKCCGCGDMYYIQSQTETLYQSKWDTHNDYLLKNNKIWICTRCTYSNTNMDAAICYKCKRSRFAGANDMLCNNCDEYIHPLSFTMHQIHCMKSNIHTSDKQTCTWWICPKCNATETKNETKCNLCDCKRPTEHRYFKVRLNQDLVYGFCRKYFRKYIPVAIKDIMVGFVVLRAQTFSVSCVRFACNAKNVTRYYNEGFRVQLCGDQYIDSPDKEVWKLQLNVDSKYDVRLDGDTDAAKVYDIRVGAWCLIDYFNKKEGKIMQEAKYYTITGDGRYSYPTFRNDDVIIVELDCEQHTLSFGINEDWYGVEFDNLPQYTKYQLYVEVKQQGVIINVIN